MLLRDVGLSPTETAGIKHGGCSWHISSVLMSYWTQMIPSNAPPPPMFPLNISKRMRRLRDRDRDMPARILSKCNCAFTSGTSNPVYPLRTATGGDVLMFVRTDIDLVGATHLVSYTQLRGSQWRWVGPYKNHKILHCEAFEGSSCCQFDSSCVLCFDSQGWEKWSKSDWGVFLGLRYFVGGAGFV